ncbi:MAG: phosphotransferase [Candidatus Cloacimonadaceae bacterium]|nr:phosphotransferase [Candidatus Cloacimonadaceae bacterium]
MIHKKPAPSAEVLTHGDFNLRNLLFDETGVCAYLDLGEVGSCDAYQDFSTLRVSMEQYLGDTAAAADIMQEVLSEYGIETIDMEKIACFRLLNELL